VTKQQKVNTMANYEDISAVLTEEERAALEDPDLSERSASYIEREVLLEGYEGREYSAESIDLAKRLYGEIIWNFEQSYKSLAQPEYISTYTPESAEDIMDVRDASSLQKKILTYWGRFSRLIGGIAAGAEDDSHSVLDETSGEINEGFSELYKKACTKLKTKENNDKNELFRQS